MKMIELTTSVDNNPIYFVINGNVTFYDHLFQDGNHNNTGWKVKETAKEIAKIILEAKDI